MSNTSSNGRSGDYDGRTGADLASPPTVLYVTHTSPGVRSVPSILDAEYGMDVHVVTEFPAARTALNEESVDCVVAESATPETAADELLTFLGDGRRDLPVLVYADPDCDPRRWFRAGADDFLSRSADTDRYTLLAHRIERCVASRRAHATGHRFRTAVEGMDLPFLIADADGRIEYVNRAFETLLGDDRRGLVDRPLTDLRAAHDETWYRDCWETVTDGETWCGDLVVGGDGADETRRIDLTVTPVRNDDGSVERIVAAGAERSADGRESEGTRQQYRELIDTAPDAIFVADTDTGVIVEANDAAAALIDRPREEIVGMHQSDLHPDGERDRYRQLFDYHQNDGESVRSRIGDDPICVETADGDRIPVEINARVVELGDRTLFQGHFRDVSERRDRERKLRAVLDAIPDIAIVYSESGRYEEVLSGRDDLLVGSADALEGKDIHEALPPEPADRVLDAIHETIETGTTQNLEYRLPLDGDPHHFAARIAPLRTEAYESECVIFLARDVTERKRREQDFRSFRKAVEHAGHVIMITDTDGTIEYVNPEFESVTGYSKSEICGRTPNALSSGEHGAECYRTLWETILDGDVWEGELINERKDGERYHIEQTIAPITDEEGTIERFVAVNTDITDRKQYEYQLERERDRLEEFARTVAHDLRNPLSIAVGHVDIARQSSDGVDPSLERALSALERMETMIEEVLTLSKQGETVREPEPVHFGQVVDVAWQHADTDTETATRSMTEAAQEWTVSADESRLRQLLENLFRNAVKHAGPDVTIRIGRLSDREGFFVEDDGPGIEPNARNRIFESGFTSDDDGTGFGLAIVKQIVEAHGWDIAVVNAEGDAGGARFEITTRSTGYREHAVDRE